MVAAVTWPPVGVRFLPGCRFMLRPAQLSLISKITSRHKETDAFSLGDAGLRSHKHLVGFEGPIWIGLLRSMRSGVAVNRAAVSGTDTRQPASPSGPVLEFSVQVFFKSAQPFGKTKQMQRHRIELLPVN